MPWLANMNCHSLAVTAVGIAHGISTAARTSPRPRYLPFMIKAMAMPRMISRLTVTTVKNSVIPTAGQKSVASEPGGQVIAVPSAPMQRLLIHSK